MDICVFTKYEVVSEGLTRASKSVNVSDVYGLSGLDLSDVYNLVDPYSIMNIFNFLGISARKSPWRIRQRNSVRAKRFL